MTKRIPFADLLEEAFERADAARFAGQIPLENEEVTPEGCEPTLEELCDAQEKGELA